MRTSTASARDPRGERTLMGIGPEFLRREVVAEGVAGTLDCVPTERMDRTPSAPIVVEPQSVTPPPAATMRIPIPTPARTVQMSIPRRPTNDATDAPIAAGKPSMRLDSLVSGRFFQEGEQQEASGWEDSPLACEPSPDEEPPKVSSFDHVPRRRGPLIVTTFLLGLALVIGVAVKGSGAIASARTMLANEAGSRATGIWDRAKSGLALRLTPESTAATAQAMAAPVLPAQPAAVEKAPVVAAPAAPDPRALVASAPVAAAPVAIKQPARAPRPMVAMVRKAKPVAAPAIEDQGSAPVAATTDNAVPRGAIEEAVAKAAPETEPQPAETARRAEAPRRGLVWSPSQQRLVPAEPAADVPAPDTTAQDTPSRAADSDSAPKGADKDVLPLDDQAHATY